MRPGILILVTALLVIVTNGLAAQEGPAELVAALSGEDAVARFLAEEEFIKMGKDAVPILEPLVTSPGLTLERQYAINILAQIGDAEATQLLLRILEQDQDVMVRAQACRILGQRGTKEAVPLIGHWLTTIQGKPLYDWNNDRGGDPQVLTPAYGWIVHVDALREIGSEQAIPILEKMLASKHKGRAGRTLGLVYRQSLKELQSQAAFWQAVRQIPGLEPHVRSLFQFFRRDDLARMRLYRDRVVYGGLEGRWVLEDMGRYPDDQLRLAAETVLREYEQLATHQKNVRRGQ